MAIKKDETETLQIKLDSMKNFLYNLDRYEKLELLDV